MKFYLIVMICIAVLSLSCNTRKADVKPEPTAPPQEKPLSAAVGNVNLDTQWHDAMEETDPDIIKRYGRAMDLLRAAAPQNAGFVLKDAMRLGNWFVLSINPIEVPSEGASIAVNQRLAYVVDMAAEHVLGNDEWRAVLPLFMSYAEQAPMNRALQESKYVLNLARLAAAVAAENTEVLTRRDNRPYPDEVTPPRVSFKNGFMLTWYSANSSNPPLVVRYEISLADGLTFHSEMIQMPEMKKDDEISTQDDEI